MGTKEIIRETVNLILKDHRDQIDAILLFGSHADGTQIWRSDIDICVVFKKELDLKEATLFRVKIAGQVSDKIDIQVFNTLPLKVKKSIADNHIILFNTLDFDEFLFTKRNRSLFFDFKEKIAAVGL